MFWHIFGKNRKSNKISTVGLLLEEFPNSGEISFFTPFVAEVPYHILLYVVVHCKKGVVELTYK